MTTTAPAATPPPAAPPSSAPAPGPDRPGFWRRFRDNRPAFVALVVLAVLVLDLAFPPPLPQPGAGSATVVTAADGTPLRAFADDLDDATGDLVAPPLVDPHFHMDATLSYGLPRVNASGTLLEGISLWGELREIATVEEMVERALRAPVLGRKNHYGSKSERGTEVAAAMYSLIETAKHVGLNPLRYLVATVGALLRGEEAMLPHEYAAAERQRAEAAGDGAATAATA